MPDQPPPPTAATLHEAALNYLARYAATEAGLRGVLSRRVDRWARTAVQDDRDAVAATVATLKADVRAIVARLAAAGLVNDEEFARTRAIGLLRSGRSRRAIAARLAAKGIGVGLSQQVIPDDQDAELDAALILARKRRIGPFRREALADLAAQHRELAVLARAGFPQALAARALAMPADEAEARIDAFRRSATFG